MAFSVPLSLAAIGVSAYALYRQRQTVASLRADISRTHEAIADHAKAAAIHTRALKAISQLQQIDHFRVDILAAQARIAVHPKPIDPSDVIAEAQRIVGGGK